MQLYFLAAVSFFTMCGGELVLKEASYLRMPDRKNHYAINSRSVRDGTFDSSTNYLYTIGRESGALHVVSYSDVHNPRHFYSFNFDMQVTGRPLDISVCRGLNPGRKYLAISFEGINSDSYAGHVGLYHVFESESDVLTAKNPLEPTFRVGSHPANIEFTHDCVKLVIACEGISRIVEGRFDDPEGSVDIATLPIANDVLPVVDTVYFHDYDNDQTKLQDILAKDVRYWIRQDPLTTSNPTALKFSQTVEPGHIAISPSDGYAYITLQSSNAIARVDINNAAALNILPVGKKNWTLLTSDMSDRDGGIHMANRKVLSFYQPDNILFFTFNQVPYLLTLDEGKATNLIGTTYQDWDVAAARDWNTGDSGLNADLKDDAKLGRLRISTTEGVSQIPQVPIAFGGRGFSIWNPNVINFGRVYESADELERLSSNHFPDTFNGDCSNFNSSTPADQRDARSGFYGPEVGAVAVGDYQGHKMIVMGGSRNGLLYVWSFIPTLPIPVPDFQSVHRAGSTNAVWNSLYSQLTIGDAGISDILFANPADPFVIVISQISGSISAYTIQENTT